MASRKAKKKLQSIVTTRKNAEMFAFLGDLYTGDLFVRAGNYTRMYATIAFTGQVIKVRNKRFPARFKNPVKLGHAPGSAEIEVIDEWRGVYPNLDLPILPFHPHTWGETENVAWIRKEQIMELSPFVKEGMIVLVNSGSFVINGVRRGFMYQEFDMTSYIPASGARWVTCEIDNTGAITYTEGTLYDSRTLLDISNVPAVTDEKYLLFAVKVYFGQTELMFLPDNNDLYDPRLTWQAGRSFTLLWDDIEGKPNLDVPVRGAYRWIGDGVETEFMLTDYLEELEQVFDNSLLVDPFVVNLSSDGGSVVFDDAPTDGHVIMAYGVLRSL